MDLLEVDCGNGVERGLLNTPRPQPASLSLGMAKSKCNLSPLYLLSLSPPPPVDLRLAAAMRGDLWPIVIYVVVGLAVRDVGRWRRKDGSEAGPKETIWLQPSTSFHLHLQHSLVHSLLHPRRVTMVTRSLVRRQVRPSGRSGDPAVSAETDTCSGCVEIKTDDRLMLMTEAGAATHHVVWSIKGRANCPNK